MSILVTGGAGFIGSNFVLDWLAQSDEPVINLDKLTYAGNLENLAALTDDRRHIFVQGDICDRPLIDQLLNFPRADEIRFDPERIDADAPEEVMEKLLKVPYFARAYDEDGYTREEYNTHPALVRTAEAFSKATNEMVAFADSCLKGACKA